MTIRAVVKGVGHYLPERVVPNSEFEKTLETTDEWIRSRSGIERRHFAAEGEYTSDLAEIAARRALEDANMDADQVDAAAKSGADFIELHTGQFAHHFGNARNRQRELNRLIAAATHAHGLGLRVNAGHGINYENLPTLFAVPHLEELNIGHSIISHAMSVGLPKAVKEMLRIMKGYRGGA